MAARSFSQNSLRTIGPMLKRWLSALMMSLVVGLHPGMPESLKYKEPILLAAAVSEIYGG